MALAVSVQTRRPTVLLVDGESLFRDGMRHLLSQLGEVDVVGGVATADQALNALPALAPDVVVLSTGVEAMAETIREIRRRAPATAVLMMQPGGGEVVIGEAFNAGATGYLLRTCGIDTVASAIYTLQWGETVFEASLAEHVFAGSPAPAAAYDGLTPRELEVLRLVASGCTYKQVAMRMRVTYKTVRNYVSSIYRKLSIFDRSQVALYAMRKGLIDPEPSAR